MKKSELDKLAIYREPSNATLKKYGLKIEEWRVIYNSQGGVCAVCGKVPKTGIFHIDHKHIPKYKHLPPEIRRVYVRGLLCQFCNRFYLAKAMTAQKAANIVQYLTRFEINKPS